MTGRRRCTVGPESTALCVVIFDDGSRLQVEVPAAGRWWDAGMASVRTALPVFRRAIVGMVVIDGRQVAQYGPGETDEVLGL